MSIPTILRRCLSTHTFPPPSWRTTKFAMVTAYDYPQARAAAELQLPILVGDSLANTALGFNHTHQATMNHMVHHFQAVRRGAPQSFIVADMPYRSDCNPRKALRNTRRLIKHGADSVKLEGPKVLQVQHLTKHKIPVIAHIGVCPQTDASFRTVGRDPNSTETLLHQAVALEDAGAIAVVLENIAPSTVSLILHRTKIPTIGIYSGHQPAGQVMVFNDLMGLPSAPVRTGVTTRNALVDVYGLYVDALARYRDDVTR